MFLHVSFSSDAEGPGVKANAEVPKHTTTELFSSFEKLEELTIANFSRLAKSKNPEEAY